MNHRYRSSLRPTSLLAWVVACGVGIAYGADPVAATVDLTRVPIPKLALFAGDSLDPLPAGSPLPSPDPKNFEGTWVALGTKRSTDNMPPPYRPEVLAQIQHLRDLDKKGTPVIAKYTLCRPGTFVDIGINEFPTEILQRPDKILFIAEEGRSIWTIYMNQAHPKELKPSRLGHNVGHWEGNTLVIDSIGFTPTPLSNFGNGSSVALHVVTRIQRANTGDKLNGDRLVITREIDDPAIFSHPWTQVGVARWRPDLDMLEFNCEEAPPEVQGEGLTVQ
jgi:hypothetical protein